MFCVLRNWPVPGGVSKFSAVADCESGWGRFAYNPSGPYVGLFQHQLNLWDYRVRHQEPPGWELKPGWRNSRTQIVVTAKMAHAGGWGPWSCA